MSAALVLRTLERLERGRLEVALPGGARRAFGEPNGAAADLQVRNLNAFARVLRFESSTADSMALHQSYCIPSIALAEMR